MAASMDDQELTQRLRSLGFLKAELERTRSEKAGEISNKTLMKRALRAAINAPTTPHETKIAAAATLLRVEQALENLRAEITGLGQELADANRGWDAAYQVLQSRPTH